MGENTRVLRYGDLWVPLKARQKEQGDEEAQGIDETFIDAYVLCYCATYIWLMMFFLESLEQSCSYRWMGYG